MISLRQRSTISQWAYQLIRTLSLSTVRCISGKEILNKVDSYSRIKVKCNYNLKIVPYDLLDCPDSNLLKIIVPNTDREPEVKISGKDVSIVDSGDAPVSCFLQIPIKADLAVENLGNTTISELYSDTVYVQSGGNIDTKNLRCTGINVRSNGGDISCRGTTLAQTVSVLTGGEGKILLEKLQGDVFEAESNLGSITVNSSYSNSASFKTSQGDLLLKNVHKSCTVLSEGSGKLVMNGFYGTLQVEVGSREVSLQLSEIHGQSKVIAKAAKDFCLAVSENVIENAKVFVNSELLELEPELDGTQISTKSVDSLGVEAQSTENTLQICSGGLVRVKKMSWMDTFGFSVEKD
ncbi:uncharacterized protein LOC129729262 [Wyeomyia smithii]|uniref:uncharacterized protein LOC129729262 n=1 Tax=Wyeomyia smithii TaxID=174621 RepID=UPI002468079A|nr:uncharacterized protein LOC129729262 [Wyeomyia smithii]